MKIGKVVLKTPIEQLNAATPSPVRVSIAMALSTAASPVGSMGYAGRLTAFDAKTSAILWRSYTLPDRIALELR
jgi:hypothetical protein